MEWDYEHFPDHSTKLLDVTSQLLLELRDQPSNSLDNVKNTRAIHGRLFNGLTPAGHGYFAGHYRG